MSMTTAGQYIVIARNTVGTVASSSAALSMFGMAMTNGLARLTVAAPTGSHFRIEYSDRLGSAANWQTMTNFTVMGSMSQITETSSTGSLARFYRAMMMP